MDPGGVSGVSVYAVGIPINLVDIIGFFVDPGGVLGISMVLVDRPQGVTAV